MCCETIDALTFFGRHRSRLSRDVRLGVAALGLASGVTSVAIARHNPTGSFGGGSIADGIIELCGGWSLLAAGLVFWSRRPRNRFGLLLTAAGFVWFLSEWSNPGVRFSLVFTVGLVGMVACLPLVAHAALAYPLGRVRSVLERGAVAAGYVVALGLLGLLPATVFDPRAQGCLQCPGNLILVRSDTGAFDAFWRWGLRMELAWAIAVVVLIAWRLVRPGAPLVHAGPLLVPAAVYLSLVARDLQHSLARNGLGNDPFDVRLWRYEAAALVVLACGVAWSIYGSLRARAAVARLVLDLGRSSAPGGARDVLAHALGDGELQLAFRRPGSDEYVDAQGGRVDVEPGANRAVTPLLRDGRAVAALVHDPALAHDPGRIEEVVAAARLMVENESFQVDLRAQFESLRASRVRIVEAGDLERRRLERDLHDGAQQRLVGLALLLRMLRNRTPDPSPELQARLDEADSELRATLAELRELAHGIFPAVLADEGLTAAIETLADGSPATIIVRAVPEARLDAAVEATAYFVISEVLGRAQMTRASVAASRSEGRLVVELEIDGDLNEPVIDLEDRVGALDGRFAVELVGGNLRVYAELPCA